MLHWTNFITAGGRLKPLDDFVYYARYEPEDMKNPSAQPVADGEQIWNWLDTSGNGYNLDEHGFGIVASYNAANNAADCTPDDHRVRGGAFASGLFNDPACVYIVYKAVSYGVGRICEGGYSGLKIYTDANGYLYSPASLDCLSTVQAPSTEFNVISVYQSANLFDLYLNTTKIGTVSGAQQVQQLGAIYLGANQPASARGYIRAYYATQGLQWDESLVNSILAVYGGA